MIRNILALGYGLLGIVLLAMVWYPALKRDQSAADPPAVPTKRYVVGSTAGVLVLAGAWFFHRRARGESLPEIPADEEEDDSDEDEDPYRYR